MIETIGGLLVKLRGAPVPAGNVVQSPQGLPFRLCGLGTLRQGCAKQPQGVAAI